MPVLKKSVTSCDVPITSFKPLNAAIAKPIPAAFNAKPTLLIPPAKPFEALFISSNPLVALSVDVFTSFFKSFISDCKLSTWLIALSVLIFNSIISCLAIFYFYLVQSFSNA